MMVTSSLIALWLWILLPAVCIFSIAQPVLSNRQIKQSSRQSRSPETFKPRFTSTDEDSVAKFINSHGSPLMTRSNSGFNKDDIQPLLMHATDEELSLLYAQAKQLRRQEIESQEFENQKKFNDRSLFSEVNLENFQTKPSEQRKINNPFQSELFSDQRKEILPIELFPEEFLSHRKSPPNPTVFTNPVTHAPFITHKDSRFRSIQEDKKPRIHFPNKQLKSEIPAVDLNSDLDFGRSTALNMSPLQTNNRLAFELFLQSSISPKVTSSPQRIIPTLSPRATFETQPIFEPRVDFDLIQSKITGSSTDTLSLFDSIQQRINQRTEKLPLNSFQKTDSFENEKFPNFQRSSVQELPRRDAISSKSQSREANLEILKAIANRETTTKAPRPVNVVNTNATAEEKRRKTAGEKRRKQLFNLERRRLLDSKRRRQNRTRIRTTDKGSNSNERVTEKPRTSTTTSEAPFTINLKQDEEVVVDNAVKAILDRAAAGSVKDSPIVWAAIKTIYNFIDAQKKSDKKENTPQNILMAITQLTEFLQKGEKSEKVEAMETFNVETVNSFVKSKTKNDKIIVELTTPKHSQRDSLLGRVRPTEATLINSKIIQENPPIDMYTDESITGNDYNFDYENSQDVQFKFRFQPQSKKTTKLPSLRENSRNRNFFTQQPFKLKPKTTEKVNRRPTSESYVDYDDYSSPFKLNFDPKSGLYSTSIDQFQAEESKPNRESILQEEQQNTLKRPKFQIFTLPI